MICDTRKLHVKGGLHDNHGRLRPRRLDSRQVRWSDGNHMEHEIYPTLEGLVGVRDGSKSATWARHTRAQTLGYAGGREGGGARRSGETL